MTPSEGAPFVMTWPGTILTAICPCGACCWNCRCHSSWVITAGAGLLIGLLGTMGWAGICRVLLLSALAGWTGYTIAEKAVSTRVKSHN
jgi:hypothetical protein